MRRDLERHMVSPSLRVELQPRTWHARHPVDHAARPHVEVTLSQEYQQALARAGIQEAFGPGGSELGAEDIEVLVRNAPRDAERGMRLSCMIRPTQTNTGMYKDYAGRHTRELTSKNLGLHR